MPRCVRWLVPALLCLLAPVASADGEAPYPVGRSVKKLEGLKTILLVPETKPTDRPYSLVVALHAAAAPAGNMADLFETWPAEGYVVCAPQAKDLTWEVGDLDAVIRLIPKLVDDLDIDPARVHLVGYSNGGTQLDRVAFDDDVKACSATWVAATYTGNKVPRWARKDLGVLALLGARDEELDRLRSRMAKLDGKVGSVEVRVAKDVGHRFPHAERPYLLWWMGVQEGRLEPGKDLSLRWTEDLDKAIALQAGEKKGGVFVWIYGAADAEKPGTADLQRRVLLNDEVRFFAEQLECVKLDGEKNKALLEKLELTTSPALVVMDTKGEVVKLFAETFSPRKVAAALKKVVPNRKLPR